MFNLSPVLPDPYALCECHASLLISCPHLWHYLAHGAGTRPSDWTWWRLIKTTKLLQMGFVPSMPCIKIIGRRAGSLWVNYTNSFFFFNIYRLWLETEQRVRPVLPRDIINTMGTRCDSNYSRRTLTSSWTIKNFFRESKNLPTGLLGETTKSCLVPDFFGEYLWR